MILNQILLEVQVLTDSSAGLITISGDTVKEFRISDWLEENFEWIYALAIVLIYPLLIIYFERGKLLNRKIKVKRIVSKNLEKRGDIKFDEEKITARFFWTKRTNYWKNITEISAYSTDYCEAETWEELINIKFRRGITIVFNSKIKEQIEIVNREKNKLGLENIDIARELSSGDEEKPIIFYKKH